MNASEKHGTAPPSADSRAFEREERKRRAERALAAFAIPKEARAALADGPDVSGGPWKNPR